MQFLLSFHGSCQEKKYGGKIAETSCSDLKMVNCKIGQFLTVGWNWMGTPREQFFARNLCMLLRFFGPTQTLCLKYVSIVYRWRLQLQGPRGPVPVRVSSHGLLFQCLLLKFFNNSLIYYLHISPSFVKSSYTIALTAIDVVEAFLIFMRFPSQSKLIINCFPG